MGIFDIFKKKNPVAKDLNLDLSPVPSKNYSPVPKNSTQAPSYSQVPVVVPGKQSSSPADIDLNLDLPKSTSASIVVPQKKTFGEKVDRIGSSLGAGVVQGVGSIADIGGFVNRQVSKGYDKLFDAVEIKPIPKLQKFADEHPLFKKTVAGLNDATRQTTEQVRDPYAKKSTKIKEKAGITDENQTYWEKVAESFGYSAPAMAVSLYTGGIGGAVLGGGIEAAGEAQGVYDSLVKEHGENYANKRAAATFASNAVLNTITDKLGYLSEGIKKPLKKFVVSALMELGQEDAQQVISNLATGRAWHEGIGETTLLALPQTLIFGGAGVLSDRSRSKKEKAQAKAVEDLIYNGDKGGPAFKEDEEKNLILSHNISEQKIRQADDIGGLANPSMAVFDPQKNDFSGYGDVSLIGDKSLVEEGKTFGSDVYSPRFPKVDTRVDYKTQDAIVKELKEKSDSIGLDRGVYVDNNDAKRSLENSEALMAKFLDDKKIPYQVDPESSYETVKSIRQAVYDNNLQEDFNIYVDDYLKQKNVSPELFDGYTYSGKRRYKPLTVENASKMMNKENLRAGEGAVFNHTGVLNARLVKQYKSIPQIKKASSRLVSSEEFNKQRDEIDARFSDLAGEMYLYRNEENKSDSFSDRMSANDDLSDFIVNGRDRYITEKYNEFPNEFKNKVQKFKEDLLKIPTEYFETKFKRPVKIGEFKYALVPKNANKKTIEILENAGLKVKTYDPNIEGDRQKKMQTEFTDAMFKEGVADFDQARALAGIMKLEEYKKRLKLKFDTYFVNTILSNNGKNALGVTYDNTITLAQNITKYTADHEMVHLVLRNLNDIPVFSNLSLEKIFAEAKTRYGENLTNRQLEEKIAEEMEKYAAAQESKKGGEPEGQIGKLLKTIYEQLKSFFSLGQKNISQIDEFFKTLYSGKGTKEVVLKQSGNAEKMFKTGDVSFENNRGAKFKEDGGEFQVSDAARAYQEEYNKNVPVTDSDFADLDAEMEKQPSLKDEREMLDITEEAFESSPFKELIPYVVKNKENEWYGKLPELQATMKKRKPKNGRVTYSSKEERIMNNKFAQDGDSMIREIFEGYNEDLQNDTELVREEFEKWYKSYKEFKQYKKETLAAIREKKQINEFLRKSAERSERMRAIEERQKKQKERLMNKGFIKGFLKGKNAEAGQAQERMNDMKRKNDMTKVKVGMQQRAKGEKTGIKIGLKQGKNIRENLIAELQRSFELRTLKGNMLARRVQDIKVMIKNYVNEKLPVSDRGRFNNMIANAKTQGDLIRSFARVDNKVQAVQKAQLISDIKKNAARIMDSQKIAVDYKEKIRNILTQFNMKKTTSVRRERLNKLREFIQNSMKNGKDIAMPQYVYDTLRILDRKPISDLSVNELANIQSSIEILEKIGNTKAATRERIYEIEKQKKHDELVAGIKPIEENETINRIPGGDKLTTKQKLKNMFPKILNFAQHVNLATMPMDIFFDIQDGSPGTYQGPASRIFKSTVDTAYGNAQMDFDKYSSPIHDLANDLKLKQDNFERIGIYGAKMQKDGNQKLLNSGLTQEYIDSIELNEYEKKFYKAIREVLDGDLYTRSSEIMRTLYNKPLGKVENYLPFMTDFDAMDQLEIFEKIGQDVPQFGLPKKNIQDSSTKERTGAGNQKIQLNAMSIFNKHVKNVTYMINMARDVKMLSEIAKTDTFMEKAGKVGGTYIREWLDLIARQGGKEGMERSMFLDTLRKNIGAAYLGFKLSSAVVQPTALIDGASIIGHHAFYGAMKVGTDRDVRKFIMKNMPELKARVGDDVAFTEFGDQGALASAQRAGMWVLKTLDGLTASSIAWGAYTKKLDELGIELDMEKPNKEAVDYAQRIVRQTQSSSEFKDSPMALSRGKLTGNRSFDKAFLQFQSFMLNRWHKTKYNFWDIGVKHKRFDRAFGQIFWLAMALFAEEGLRRLSKEAVGALTGDEPDFQDGYTTAVAKSALGAIPFVGQGMSAATFGGDTIPGLDAFQGAISGPFKISNAKSTKSKSKAVVDMLASAGSSLGVPGTMQAAQVTKSLIGKSSGSKDNLDLGFDLGNDFDLDLNLDLDLDLDLGI